MGGLLQGQGVPSRTGRSDSKIGDERAETIANGRDKVQFRAV
jgi:hypothetical protein